MTDLISFLAKTDSLAWALVGCGILSIFLGLLVPRRYYNEKIKEAETWRHAYELEREARTTAVDQTDDLLEMARTTNAVVNALFDNSQRPRRTGDPHVVSKNERD